MRRGIGFSLAWLGATILAIVVAAAAVGSVRSQVTETPTALGSPPGSVTTVTQIATPDTAPDSTSRPSVSTSTTVAPGAQTSSTTEPASTTTSLAGSAPTTTSTTIAAITTTSSPGDSYTKTYDTPAGSVRVIVDGDAVTFGGAFPNQGWKVELKNDGPEKVEVHFESNDDSDEVEFSAKVEHGELRVEISGEDDD